MRRPRMGFESTWGLRCWGRGTAFQRGLSVLALVLAAAALAVVALRIQQLVGEEADLRQKLLATTAARPATVAAGLPAKRPALPLRQLEQATAQLNVPWSDIFDTIERRTPRTVALLALEPDGKTGSVALSVEARKLDDLWAYAQALGEDSAIRAVRIANHEMRQQEPGQPVRLSLTMNMARR